VNHPLRSRRSAVGAMEVHLPLAGLRQLGSVVSCPLAVGEDAQGVKSEESIGTRMFADARGFLMALTEPARGGQVTPEAAKLAGNAETQNSSVTSF
jgi:hypothetical protein